MSIPLELLSKEIGSSINKPLPCAKREFIEISQIKSSKTKTTMDSIQNESIIPGSSTSNTDIERVQAQKPNANENKNGPISCNRKIACKFCYQIDFFVVFSIILIALMDSCLRFANSILRIGENRLHKLFNGYLLQYNNETEKVQKILKGLCVGVVAFVYIEIYLVLVILKFITKPIPGRMCNQIHDLFFKIASSPTPKDQ